MKNKKGFTLTELIIATAISWIVLIVVFGFVVDSISWLSLARNSSEKIDSFYDFTFELKKYKNSYGDILIIHNGTSTGWYDTIILKDFTSSGWVLIGLVDPENRKLVKDTTYENYKKRVPWIRILTEANLVEIGNDVNNIYEYTFFEDKIFDTLFTKDFQVEFYNTWAITELSAWVILDEYNVNFEGQKWTNIPSPNMYTNVINF